MVVKAKVDDDDDGDDGEGWSRLARTRHARHSTALGLSSSASACTTMMKNALRANGRTIGVRTVGVSPALAVAALLCLFVSHRAHPRLKPPALGCLGDDDGGAQWWPI